MNVEEVIKRAQEDFTKLNKKPVDMVTSLARTEEGWVASVETVEKRSIPDAMDVLGLYEIRLDGEGNLLGFQRKRLRKRGDTKDE